MARRSPLAFVLALLALLCAPAFLMPGKMGATVTEEKSQLLAAGGALMVASMPAPAYAGGMFDFGLTLPFVALSFLTMMFVLNALWYAPMTEEVDERNAKLLQTLSEATDMLAKADEMQVQYTADIKEAREKAAKELADARGKLRRIRLRNGQALMRQGRIWKHVPAKYKGAFHLGKLRDQPSAENSAKPLDQPSESNPIDPSTYTDAPAKALVYDSPPTAADQEEPPESITNEMSKESGATMDSDDYL